MGEQARIGVMDSGVGGLTFVREILALCPGADIIYFGDSANCPYGNQTQENILNLSVRILSFLRQNDIHAAVIACNTVSTLIDTLQQKTDSTLFSVVAPVAEAVARSGVRRVGVLGTGFTIAAGTYQRLIQAADPTVEVVGIGSAHLAAMIDRGAPFEQVEREIQDCFGPLLDHDPPEIAILGCTHYPIVKDYFIRRYPHVEFLDPAAEQAKAVAVWLERQGLQTEGEGRLKVYTSGDPAAYRSILERLGIPLPHVLEQRIP